MIIYHYAAPYGMLFFIIMTLIEGIGRIYFSIMRRRKIDTMSQF